MAFLDLASQFIAQKAPTAAATRKTLTFALEDWARIVKAFGTDDASKVKEIIMLICDGKLKVTK